MRNLLLVISAAVTFTLFTGFTSNTEKEVSKCPYIQKLHKIEKSVDCPYLKKKAELKSSDNQQDKVCPFSGKSQNKGELKLRPEKKLKVI